MQSWVIPVLHLLGIVAQMYLAYKIIQIKCDTRNLLNRVTEKHKSTRKLLEENEQLLAKIQSQMPQFAPATGVCTYCGKVKSVNLFTQRCEECKEKPQPDDKQTKFRSIDDPWEK